jgi:hypothetical protein
LEIAVSFYDRDHYSRGRNRQIFGYEAYHWAVMVVPKGNKGRTCKAYDTTDASEYDPVTHRLTNPTMEWKFRTKTVDPKLSKKLLGCVVIGTAPPGVSFDDLDAFFASIPMPQKNKDPQQSCVTWAVNALVRMQEKGWVAAFDIDRFKDWALAYADEMRRKQDEDPGEKEVAITRYEL